MATLTKLILFITVALLLASESANKSLLHVLVVLSSSQERSANYSCLPMENADLFPGAMLAAHEINKKLDLLSEFSIVPVLISVPECDPVKGIHSLFEALLDPHLNVAGVTGMFCDGVSEIYPKIIYHIEENLPQILGSQSHFFTSYSSISYLLPSTEDIISAVTEILNRLDWNKISIVAMDSSYGYSTFHYGKAAKIFKLAKVSSVEVVQEYLLQRDMFNVTTLLKGLKSANSNIFIILAPPCVANVILKEVYKEKLVWPEYAWVFIQLESPSISFSPEWDNVIIISLKNMPFYSENYSSKEDQSLEVQRRALLYDSLWAMALLLNTTISLDYNTSSSQHETEARNDIFNFSFNSRNGRVNLRGRGKWFKLDIKVIINSTELIVGRHCFKTGHLSINKTFLHPIPPDHLEVHLLPKPLAVSIIINSWIIMVHCLIISSLLLFVIFHKEKEVKASSFSLSLCIYLGTYIILLSPTILVLQSNIKITNKNFHDLICSTNGFFIFIGIDLVVATAFVKTLRIWHIFHYFGKVKKHWSDSRLLLVILVVMSIATFLFFLQMSTGDCHSVNKMIFQKEPFPPYYGLVQLCNCDKSVGWMAGSLIYTVTLLGFLFVAAIKTRKIRRKNFKDTKKIVMLICCSLVFGITMLSLWLIFLNKGQYVASLVSIIFCYSVLPFFIQVFLFLPKVLPPLYRSVSTVKVNLQ